MTRNIADALRSCSSGKNRDWGCGHRLQGEEGIVCLKLHNRRAGQLMYEHKESVQKLWLAYKQQASEVPSITTQNINELGYHSSNTHNGNHFANVYKKKKGSNGN